VTVVNSKKSSFLLFSERPGNLIGRFVFQGLVRPLVVVDRYRLGHHASCFGQVFGALQEELGFEDVINAFGQRVL